MISTLTPGTIPWLFGLDVKMRLRGYRAEKLERDKGIEPSPRPWQGRVLPLYESRLQETAQQLNIYNMRAVRGQVSTPRSNCRSGANPLP